MSFSDNIKVTEAILYYRKASDVNWNGISIINGSADIDIPQDPIEDWYYYVTVNDDANNGPVGDPSDDGSVYYTIKVLADNQDIVHYVFIEEATATWCEYCPVISDILYDLYNSGEYNFYYVSMVTDKNNEAKERIEIEYNKYVYPSVFIDGGYEVIVSATHSKSDFEEKIRIMKGINYWNAANQYRPRLWEVKSGLKETKDELSTLGHQIDSLQKECCLYL